MIETMTRKLLIGKNCVKLGFNRAPVGLFPVSARVYAAVVLRTGSAVKLREALRLARD